MTKKGPLGDQGTTDTQKSDLDQVNQMIQQLHAIMDTINVGICIVDIKSQTIHDIYSLQLEKIFRVENLKGKNIVDLLQGFLSPEQVTAERLKETIESLFGEKNSEFTRFLSALPKSIKVRSLGTSYKDIDIDWQVISDDQENMQKLLLTFNDVSMIRRMERSLKDKIDEMMALNRYIGEHVLQRFLPPDLVANLLDGKFEFDDQPHKKVITILLADLCSFTHATEVLGPDRIAKVLNSYFEAMTEIIFSEGGTIDKFMGDGILVFFGAPKEMSEAEQIQHATRCALRMQAAMRGLNAKWKLQEIEPFKLRVGLSHGEAIIGGFGGPMRKDYTAVGNSMNLASRITAAADKDEILMQKSLTSHLPSERFSSKGSFKLKGVVEEMELFKLLS